MRTSLRIWAAVLSALLMASVAAPATAATPEEPPAVERERFDREDLEASRRVADRARRPSRITEYLDRESRQGRNLDRRQLREVVLDADDGEIVLVTREDTTLETVEVASVTEGDSDYAGLGIAATPDRSAIDEPVRRTGLDAGGGFGYASAFNVSNLYLYSGNCTDAWWNPLRATVNDEDHHAFTCFEKFAQSGTDVWIYNRYGWFNKANAAGGYSGTLDFTLRSRPWAGTAGRIRQMVGHTPAQPASNCAAVANVGIGVGIASISVPIHQCANTEALARADTLSGGMMWLGKSTQTINLDYAMAVRAADNRVVPVWADYAWAEVCYSNASFTCTIAPNPRQRLLSADSGW